MTRLFSEIQFLEQNYDIVKCNIWMRQVAEIQNKVFENKRVEGKKIFQRYLNFISPSNLEADRVAFVFHTVQSNGSRKNCSTI